MPTNTALKAAGQAGVLVVAVSDMQAKVEAALKHAIKLEVRQLKAAPRNAKPTPATPRPADCLGRLTVQKRLLYDLFCTVPKRAPIPAGLGW